MQSSRNTSTKRAYKLTYTLVGWRRFIGPFEKNDMAELYTGIAALKSGTSKKGQEFKKNTIADHIIIFKQFYLWLVENEYTTIQEKKIRALKTPKHETMTKVASDLLTTDEVTAMVNSCTRSSDRAIIMMLYEGGFRIGEIGAMNWGDLTFDKWGVIVNVNFKTNKPRYIRLVMAREALAKWKNDYPQNLSRTTCRFLSRNTRPHSRTGPWRCSSSGSRSVRVWRGTSRRTFSGTHVSLT